MAKTTTRRARETQKRPAADNATFSEETVRDDELAPAGDGEVPAHYDPGSGETETEDGLDEYQEAARHGAEDVPASEKRKTMADIPVFDRGETEPKV